MNDVRISQSGGSELDPTLNTLVVHCKGSDGEDLSGMNVFGQLGCIARPYPATDDGQCEWITLPELNLIHAGRDTRIADVVGSMKAGDTVLHSTGPQHAARIFLQEDTRAATMLAKDTDGDDCYITINGTTNKLQMTIAGQGLEMSSEGTNIMSSGGYLQIKDDGHIVLNGSQVQLGNTQLGNMLVMSPTSLAALNTWMAAVATMLTQINTTLVGGIATVSGGAGTFNVPPAFTLPGPPPPILVSTNVVG